MIDKAENLAFDEWKGIMVIFQFVKYLPLDNAGGVKILISEKIGIFLKLHFKQQIAVVGNGYMADL